MLLLLVLIMSTYINNRFSFTIYKNDIKKKVTGTYDPYSGSSNLNSYLNSLSSGSTTWSISSEGDGTRFSGGSPNNYIWFNSELWRIIGVFDNTTHGQSGYLVKIIRNEPIYILRYNGTSSNTWSSSTLQAELVTYYTNNINASSKNLIQQVRWKTGSFSSLSSSLSSQQTSERSGTGTLGDVGLMYPTDYGYAALSSACPRSEYTINDYELCKAYNYLATANDEWTITPYSSNKVNYIDSDGYIARANTTSSYNVRPVVYLKSSVKKSSGTGTYDDPYTVGM